MSKQTNLEKYGIEERHNELVKSDYNTTNEYSSLNKDAISDGDPLGKGTLHGGHTHYLPDASKRGAGINYSNFDTTNGGGSFDINGRNGIGGRKYLSKISLYNEDNSYGMNSVDTSANINDGQYFVR